LAPSLFISAPAQLAPSLFIPASAPLAPTLLRKLVIVFSYVLQGEKIA
jgi:hypothetical protein